jgi:hypothetical protein
VDVNLVAGLLASYREQGGLPGPAGSLAALMGVPLPAREALERGERGGGGGGGA